MAAAKPAPGGRRSGAAGRAVARGASARRRGRITPATRVGPTTPPAGRGATPAAGTTTQPRRNTGLIALGILAALLAVAAVIGIAIASRPTVNVNVNNGGSKITLNMPAPGSSNSGPATTAPSPGSSTKPVTSPSPSASTASPSPSSSMPENDYNHWISPSDVTTACHEQTGVDKTSAVYQNALWPEQEVAKDWYCQIVQNMSYHAWYGANSSQPLGPIIATAPGVDSVDLSRYCQLTYGQAGNGEWAAENGPNDEYANSPPADGANPFPHEECVKIPGN